MHYQIEYELCALVFLIVVTVRFFSMRQFPGAVNKLFGIILYCAVADLILDIVGSYTIENAAILPAWVNYIVNTVFYSLQVIFPALMLVNAYYLGGQKFKGKRLLLLIPVAAFVFMLFINPFTGIVFYLDGAPGNFVYTRGPMFNVLFFGTVFYMICTVVVAVKHRKHLIGDAFGTIIAFIMIVCAAMLVQFIFPEYLLTGVAISLAILMMFFTLQNPESMLDMISGVFNYNALNAYLRTQIEEGRPMGLIAIDVGGIRRINSAFGVRAGNELIGQIGAFFNGLANDHHAWAFRMIGTRFLIVSGSDEAHRVILEAVKSRFAKPWKFSDMEILLIATIRYCTGQNVFDSPEDVINLIDLAYKEAGQDGWGGSRSIDTALLQTGRRAMDIEDAIRQALNSGEGFYLNYQPLYSPAEGRYFSAEVLLRLNSPNYGFISPAEFIPVAEQTGLIHQIDRMVVEKSISFLKRHPELQSCGFRRLEVNLSAAEFYKDTHELSDAIVSQCGFSTDMLCFEVTETAATTHQDILADFMHNMISHGCSFALDDFGTGYANISQILNLPFSIVKLDRSLLISEGDRDMILFSGLLKMFSRMGLDTVVEGVETGVQAQRVAQLGASHIQGYYYSRPLPEDKFAEFILQRDDDIVKQTE